MVEFFDVQLNTPRPGKLAHEMSRRAGDRVGFTKIRSRAGDCLGLGRALGPLLRLAALYRFEHDAEVPVPKAVSQEQELAFLKMLEERGGYGSIGTRHPRNEGDVVLFGDHVAVQTGGRSL